MKNGTMLNVDFEQWQRTFNQKLQQAEIDQGEEKDEGRLKHKKGLSLHVGLSGDRMHKETPTASGVVNI